MTIPVRLRVVLPVRREPAHPQAPAYLPYHVVSHELWLRREMPALLDVGNHYAIHGKTHPEMEGMTFAAMVVQQVVFLHVEDLFEVLLQPDPDKWGDALNPTPGENWLALLHFHGFEPVPDSQRRTRPAGQVVPPEYHSILMQQAAAQATGQFPPPSTPGRMAPFGHSHSIGVPGAPGPAPLTQSPWAAPAPHHGHQPGESLIEPPIKPLFDDLDGGPFDGPDEGTPE